MRRIAIASLLSVSLASTLSASTPVELFQKAKTQYRMKSYEAALATIEQLSRDSSAPENESYRVALEPSLVFYRGACLAALGRLTEARGQFQIYLVHKPNVVLDPSIYSKTVIRTLEEARRSLPAGRETAAPETGSLLASYRAFSRPDVERGGSLGEEWAEGPVRFLLTAEQRRNFLRLSDPVSRSEFVVNFWKANDPRPETLDNELQEEFDKRVAFADKHFGEDESRGSLTDRGMVFILLGPPTYIGRKPITTGEDSSDPSGMSRWSRNDVVMAQAGNDPRVSGPIVDSMTGPTNKLPEAGRSWREFWHYRREILPKGVPYQQVDFEFITRAGYGKNVLQRESPSLATMDAARRALLDHSAWVAASR